MDLDDQQYSATPNSLRRADWRWTWLNIQLNGEQVAMAEMSKNLQDCRAIRDPNGPNKENSVPMNSRAID